jgi:TPR repeat protein
LEFLINYKMKKYKDGGTPKKARLEGRAAKKMGKAQRTYKEAEATLSEAKSSGMKMDYADAEQLFNRSARQGDRAKKLKAKAAMMKTGGMVNANSKVSKQTVPGSKGVKSGVNPKAAASKVAKGRSGGTSAAPKTATPKAMYGMTMKPTMKRGGSMKKK